jgi:hypothetical protein
LAVSVRYLDQGLHLAERIFIVLGCYDLYAAGLPPTIDDAPTPSRDLLDPADPNSQTGIVINLVGPCGAWKDHWLLGMERAGLWRPLCRRIRGFPLPGGDHRRCVWPYHRFRLSFRRV